MIMGALLLLLFNVKRGIMQTSNDEQIDKSIH